MAQTDGQKAGSAANSLIFVGGVGQLYQGDLDVGRIVIERLDSGPLPDGVITEDLYYGPIAVCQRLQDLRPDTLILVGAAQHGRPAGRVTTFEVSHLARPAEDYRQAIAEAATGYVSIELILEVGSALRILPGRTLVIEIEPKSVEPRDVLSSEVERAVAEAVNLVHAELTGLK